MINNTASNHIGHLRIRQLRLLVWISEGYTLAQIAQRLHLSAAAVSVMLQELERSLGVTICERDRRGARATVLAHQLAQRARVLLAEFAHFEQALRVDDAPAQTLHIGMIPQATIEWLPRVVRALHSASVQAGQPGVRIVACEGTSTELLARVHAGELSGALARMGPGLDEAGRTLSAQLQLDVLTSESVGIVLAAGHALHRRSCITPAALAGLDWVLPEPGSYIRRLLEAYFQQHGLGTPRMALQVDTTAQAMWCAAQLGCAAAGPLSLLQGYGTGWKLKALPSRLGERVKLGFFWRESQRHLEAFGQLRQALQRCATDLA